MVTKEVVCSPEKLSVEKANLRQAMREALAANGGLGYLHQQRLRAVTHDIKGHVVPALNYPTMMLGSKGMAIAEERGLDVVTHSTGVVFLPATENIGTVRADETNFISEVNFRARTIAAIYAESAYSEDLRVVDNEDAFTENQKVRYPDNTAALALLGDHNDRANQAVIVKWLKEKSTTLEGKMAFLSGVRLPADFFENEEKRLWSLVEESQGDLFMVLVREMHRHVDNLYELSREPIIAEGTGHAEQFIEYFKTVQDSVGFMRTSMLCSEAVLLMENYPATKKLIDVVALLDYAGKLVYKGNEKRKSAFYRIHADSDVVFNGDEVLTDLIFRNVVGNAVKYGVTKRGGERPVDVYVRDFGGGVRIAVCDRGIGMTQRKLDELNDPTRIVSGRDETALQLGVEGTGIGFSTVKAFILNEKFYGKGSGIEFFSEGPEMGAIAVITMMRD